MDRAARGLDARLIKLCYTNSMKKHGSSKRINQNAARAKGNKFSVTIGLRRFAKISEIEGIKLSGEMRQRVADFDRRGSSAEERRTTIIQAHRRG